MKCFHHNDIDGYCSASIVARYTNNYNPNDYIECDYTKPFPLEVIKPGETVYFVDLSFSVNTIDDLEKLTNELHCDLVWCDHHTSSIDLLVNNPKYETINGIRMSGFSGAALTWMYFENCEFKDCPKFIQYISDFDCWKFQFADTLYFKYGLETMDLSPLSTTWNRLVRDSSNMFQVLLNMLIENGKLINQYMTKWYEDYCKGHSYESEIDGKKCLVCNIRANSLLFGELINRYPVVAIWVFNGTQYKYSIYSNKDDVDCSKIAEKFGGGGHKGAAGFTSTELLLKAKKEKENED